MNRVFGKTVLVTGGGTGIGAGIAERFAAEGAKVVVCGRRKDKLKQVTAKLGDHSGQIRSFAADIALESGINELLQFTQHEFGDIEILVNNAGIGGGQQIHQHDIPVWDRIMAVNLRAPFLLARAVLPGMRAAGSGEIVNISSEAGLVAYPGSGAYGVSKFALNALGEFIQKENQDYGIRVHTICPGMVISEMTQDSPGLNLGSCLTPEDIADLVYWLVSRRPNVKIGIPVLIQTMKNPWEQ